MELSCMECGEKVILKRGEIRRPHFAHYFNNSIPCTYYSNPNESQIHKDAKHKLALFLRQQQGINILWECPHKDKRNRGGSSTRYENHICTGEGSTQVTYQSEDRVEVEYRDPAGRFVADVAVLNGKMVKYIFELKHTHSTVEGTRPEPWFEIKAVDLICKDLKSAQGISIDLRCIRHDTANVRYCSECIFYTFPPPWTIAIPRLTIRVGHKGMWKQSGPCIRCGRKNYNPVFLKGYRQICKLCLGNTVDGTNLDEVRSATAELLCRTEKLKQEGGTRHQS
jgi:hypothetical protein